MPVPTRKQLGAWYTPDALVDEIVDHVATAGFLRRRAAGERRAVRVLDPACGDGRFLAAVAARAEAAGVRCELVGMDIDPAAIATAGARVPAATLQCADALHACWEGAGFDLVVGNPPFLSQLAASTSRGGASARGGGPYADAAAEFLALAAEAVDGHGGRVAFVLPQSLLAARDAGPVRRAIDERAVMIWSSWSGEREFDAQVLTCAVAFEFGRSHTGAGAEGSADGSWSHVITRRHGVPDVPSIVDTRAAGTLGDRARLNANFRDEYYGMVPAVGDHASGPPLVTSGLIDPGRSHWGRRDVTFARQRLDAPRIDLAALDPKMGRWAAARLVPKVLIANQTRVLEAVVDADGHWLPAVPVVAAYPCDGASVWEIAAVLTSPVASAWAWHRNAGTGLSATSIRVGPVLLADLPWPAGDLGEAVAALHAGDVRGCGAAVTTAFGVTASDALMAWWCAALDRIDARAPG